LLMMSMLIMNERRQQVQPLSFLLNSQNGERVDTDASTQKGM